MAKKSLFKRIKKKIRKLLGIQKPAKEPKRNYKYYTSVPVERYEEELKLWYEKKKGTTLDLENPKTFNEKVQWLKLYDATPLKTRLADKYLVRDWVKEKIGEEYLIPLLGAWDSFDRIDFDRLPNQFVLKANHASGYNIIVRDKSNLDYAKAREKFDKWLSYDYALRCGFELQYQAIPRKIVAEQYMADLDGDIYDYRFFCFNGTPKYVWVDVGSGTKEHKRTIFDIDWNPQSYHVNYPFIEPTPKKPTDYNKMVELAEILCKDFALVRVDFYYTGGKIYFGEMTFTPQSGIGTWEDDSINAAYGDLIQLPPKSPIPTREA